MNFFFFFCGLNQRRHGDCLRGVFWTYIVSKLLIIEITFWPVFSRHLFFFFFIERLQVWFITLVIHNDRKSNKAYNILDVRDFYLKTNINLFFKKFLNIRKWKNNSYSKLFFGYILSFNEYIFFCVTRS